MLNRSLENPRRWLAELSRVLMIAGILTGLVGRVTPTALAAGSITVDLTSDPLPIQSACTNAAGDCSLRGAIIYANAHPDTEIILTHGATYTLSIPPAGTDDPTTGDLNITADTAIDFGNVLCSLNCPATVKGGTGWNDRIFYVLPGVTVQMSGLIITNGNTANAGGGIMNIGNLIFAAGTISGNTTTDYGGGIYNSGTLTVLSSTVTGNTSQRDGGGIANYNGTLVMSNSAVTLNNAVATTTWGGGGLFIGNAGNATISASTFASNTTSHYGGGIFAGGPLTLTNTSVVTNAATLDGGGIYGYSPLSITGGSVMTNTATNSGGGLYYSSGTAVISGTNVSGNLSNQNGGGIFASGSSTSMTLSGTTVNNNHSTAGFGGGVYFNGKSLIVQANTTVNGNTIGGGFGPGIYASGDLTMTDSTVNGNSGGAESSGGGIYLHTTASTITHSTISNNTLSGGAAYGGGLYIHAGVLTMTTSTVNGNTVSGTIARGGGITSQSGSTLVLVASMISNNAASEGGGVNTGGIVTATNSTLSGNTAATGHGGGIDLPSGGTSVSLSNVTITNNHASDGGGISSVGTVTLKNSLIAGNTAGSVGPDCWGTLTSQGYNLLGNKDTCTGLTNGVNGDLVGNTGAVLNPYLGALANNGGPTKTHALLVSSPAIDAGNPASCLPTDQRGVARPVYATCDIGAYEYDGPPNPVPQINGLTPSTKTAGSVGFTLTVNGTNFVVNSVVRWNGSDRPTAYVNAGQVTALIDNVDLVLPGTNYVTVFDPAPGGGTSNSATLAVTGPAPMNPLYLPFMQK